MPLAAVALLPLAGGRAKVPRFLDPPTIQARAQDARQSQAPEKARENTKEIDADFEAEDQPIAG